jgi:hypothetical protein
VRFRRINGVGEVVDRSDLGKLIAGNVSAVDVTRMSQLQYQKQLRSQEARRLMRKQNIDAGNVPILVSYERFSQLSRGYRRLFGTPPQRASGAYGRTKKFLNGRLARPDPKLSPLADGVGVPLGV